MEEKEQLVRASWSPGSYQDYSSQHQPEWPDNKHLNHILDTLKKLPALVFSGETRMLKGKLSEINKGNQFLLQIGNCSESFSDCNGPLIHNFLRIIMQMDMILSLNGGKEIIKVGRIAGQYAKPRSQVVEEFNGKQILTYRGDNVNSDIADENQRIPNPDRLLEGYFRSAATLNLIRAFTQGDYPSLDNLEDWEQHFFKREIQNLEYYQRFEEKLDRAISKGQILWHRDTRAHQIFISHEALLLNYEEVFTRLDTIAGGYYDTSAHMLWVGDRTRQPEGAHVEFMRGIGNPLGIKIGPEFKPSDIVNVIKTINPKNEKGKVVLISRMGKNLVTKKLPELINTVESNSLEVIWSCDPMHGNTFTHNGYKTRSFDDIAEELRQFFKICRIEKVIPGGVHLEVTSENVTECIGGISGLTLKDLPANYKTKVDPRLNAAQALELAFIISELM
jgi:3-deoxy-7-phosphoheptulonate synthase